MILRGKSYHEVKELLSVSYSFISEWKKTVHFSCRRKFKVSAILENLVI